MAIQMKYLINSTHSHSVEGYAYVWDGQSCVDECYAEKGDIIHHMELQQYIATRMKLFFNENT